MKEIIYLLKGRLFLEWTVAICSLQQAAPKEGKRYFEIKANGSFMLDVSSFQVALL